MSAAALGGENQPEKKSKTTKKKGFLKKAKAKGTVLPFGTLRLPKEKMFRDGPTLNPMNLGPWLC